MEQCGTSKAISSKKGVIIMKKTTAKKMSQSTFGKTVGIDLGDKNHKSTMQMQSPFSPEIRNSL
jgi:hypothetical protein